MEKSRVRRYRILPILVLVASGMSSMPRAEALVNANDVSLELSFVDGISAFNPGDPIRLQLVFTARRPGLSLNVTATTPPSPVDTVILTPLDGVFNWMEDQAGGHRYAPDYAALANLEPGKPVTVTLTLNDVYRFDAPGRYHVHVSSRRLSGGMQDLGRVLSALTSNDLTFDINTLNARAEAAEADRLEQEIRAATDQRTAQALAEQLDYLAGDAATKAKLSLFLQPKTFYPFGVDVAAGLWIARNRKLVVLRLEEALGDPAQMLDAGTGVFETTVALASRLQTLPVPASDIEARLCHLVGATLPQRAGAALVDAARTLFVTLIRNKQIGSPDFQLAREVLITHFEDVDQYNVDWLLNAHGKYLDDPRLNPILLRMLQKPNVSRSAILHYLGLHNSDHVRPVFASELCAAHPASFNELLDTTIETIPEADTCLLDRIRQVAAESDFRVGFNSIELQNRIGLAARFASPAIYDALFALYTSGGKHWPSQAQGYALAYLNKWRPSEAGPLLDAALPPDAAQMDPNITFALFQAGSSGTLLPFLRDRLTQASPGQAETAAYYISQHGPATDRYLLRARLDHWHAEWLGKDIPADQARLEAELTSAFAYGANWQAPEAERDTLRSACLTQICRDWFPQAPQSH